MQVREDFIELVRFCKADDKLDLPARLCAEYAIKLARLTQFHPMACDHHSINCTRDFVMIGLLRWISAIRLSFHTIF